ILSVAVVLGTSIAQLARTKQGTIDGGRFPWRRWALTTSAFVLTIATVESARDEEARLRLYMLALALFCAGVMLRKAWTKTPTVYDALASSALVCFALIEAALLPTANSTLLFYGPLGLMAILFVLMILKRRTDNPR